MADLPGTTRAQTQFLRAFRTNPNGPPPQDWPSPAILRRWLRSRAFLNALQSLTNTLRLQADFHLAAASMAAAQSIQANVASASAPDQAALTQRLNALSSLLRLSHQRQRLSETLHSTIPLPPPPPLSTQQDLLDFLRKLPRNFTVADALFNWKAALVRADRAAKQSPTEHRHD